MRLVRVFFHDATFCLAGPFKYIDLYGAKPLVDRMLKYQEWYGNEFQPCRLLLEHARDSNKKFYK